MGRVEHEGIAAPVLGESLDVLDVRAAQEGEPAKVEILGVEEFAGVDRRLHHHGGEPARPLGGDHSTEVVQRGRHRDGAGDVLARREGGEGLLDVEADGGAEVDGVDGRIGQNLLEGGELAPALDAGEGLLARVADDDLGNVRVGAVDRHELRAEAKADDGDGHGGDIPVGDKRLSGIHGSHGRAERAEAGDPARHRAGRGRVHRHRLRRPERLPLGHHRGRADARGGPRVGPAAGLPPQLGRRVAPGRSDPHHRHHPDADGREFPPGTLHPARPVVVRESTARPS